MKTTSGLLIRQFVLLEIIVWFVCVLLLRHDVVVNVSHKKLFKHQKPEDQHNLKDLLNDTVIIDNLKKRKVPQNDTELIDLIRSNFIQAPSNLPYNLSNPWMMRSQGQVPYVDRQLKFLVSSNKS